MILTKGNVIVENIKIGDIHYEYEYNIGIKCEVISLPIREDNGAWSWKSRNLISNEIIEYKVCEGYEHYSSNLYDYEAYDVKYYI